MQFAHRLSPVGVYYLQYPTTTITPTYSKSAQYCLYHLQSSLCAYNAYFMLYLSNDTKDRNMAQKAVWTNHLNNHFKHLLSFDLSLTYIPANYNWILRQK